MDTLKDKILNKQARIGIIGLGYVGLPLAVEFANAGFHVTGIDVDTNKTAKINNGVSYILDVSTAQVKNLVLKKRLVATTDYKVIKKMDAVIICVPTPLRKTREPDISYILAAINEVEKFMRKNQLIILESTTYTGTTEEVLLPKLSSCGFKVGKDFFLAFSPERVDPGNKKFNTKSIAKVVGGITRKCTQMAALLYSQIIYNVIPVSSAKTAEMVKLLENTFRSVNIGLANELALMCNKMGIDVWEVIEAAKTKPFGFMPFYPGPGLGGHCLPIDPLYLSWKARMYGFEARFIELASQINSSMPRYVVEETATALNRAKKSINGSKILILGVTYKRDVNDVRESPAIEIITLLKEMGANVYFHDPYINRLTLDGGSMRSISLNKKTLSDKDCIIIVTDHSTLDYSLVARASKLIVDTRNALSNIKADRRKIVKI